MSLISMFSFSHNAFKSLISFQTRHFQKKKKMFVAFNFPFFTLSPLKLSAAIHKTKIKLSAKSCDLQRIHISESTELLHKRGLTCSFRSLTFYQTTIFLELKILADDNLDMRKMMELLCNEKENIVGEEEIGFQLFRFFMPPHR